MISRHHRGNRPGRVPSTKTVPGGVWLRWSHFFLRQQSRPKRCLVGAWSCPLCFFAHYFLFCLVSDAVFCQILEQILEHIYQSHASSLHLRCKRIPADTSRGIPCLEFHSFFCSRPDPISRRPAGGEGRNPPSVHGSTSSGRRATGDGRRTKDCTWQDTSNTRVKDSCA